MVIFYSGHRTRADFERLPIVMLLLLFRQVDFGLAWPGSR